MSVRLRNCLVAKRLYTHSDHVKRKRQLFSSPYARVNVYITSSREREREGEKETSV